MNGATAACTEKLDGSHMTNTSLLSQRTLIVSSSIYPTITAELRVTGGSDMEIASTTVI